MLNTFRKVGAATVLLGAIATGVVALGAATASAAPATAGAPHAVVQPASSIGCKIRPQLCP
ncbi:hypothetical protein [Kutzneria sp. NPDC052558]|uniref:hypothetical protein n=1 Tax=Kutzneria sp. NPDC052558 TaxID=3364121 RepID=UPI0037CAEB0A